ncbi:putative protein phosphatase 2C-like protein 44 [Rhodamnia argentea]|uniref:PPM-type phosphatase domain-containing protein n=1 Tax=Rhodamnia argentea TaxID=178133 RepID=A0A8B8PGS0_9MYRT|nr:putative protein phosphatase 2C-like protein 44 [Rhodamnia argentea]
MRIIDFHLKLKVCRIRRFLTGNFRSKKRKFQVGRKPAWMMQLSHGHFVHEKKDGSDSDSVVIQREQIQGLELWLFGVFDAQIGDRVAKYLQSHLFDKKPNESQIVRKTEEMTRKAYLSARAKIRVSEKKKMDGEALMKAGSASVMVVNGEKLVTGNMGEYRAVVCRNGVAKQTTSKHQQSPKRHWIQRFIPGRMLAWNSSREDASNQSKSSKLRIGVERIDTNTEFVILASSGIWEVMNNQEAVNLVRHMESPQEASECLAKEALARMSRGSISCLVVRFEDV